MSKLNIIITVILAFLCGISICLINNGFTDNNNANTFLVIGAIVFGLATFGMFIFGKTPSE